MVDIPPDARESMWQRTTRRLVEARLWDKAETFADVCELSAQFCEGKLERTPGHLGPRMPETVQIDAELAHANRQGFLTEGSQPGEDKPLEWSDGARYVQRAAVTGFATPETVRRLHGLVAGTRLVLMVHEPLQRRDVYAHRLRVAPKVVRVIAKAVTKGGDAITEDEQDALSGPRYRDHVPVTKAVFADGSEHIDTHFGHRLTEGEAASEFAGGPPGDEIAGAQMVTIYDPEWGPSRLLWNRLGQADWNNPQPAPEDTPEQRCADLDVVIERLAAGERNAAAHGWSQHVEWLREEREAAERERESFTRDNPASPEPEPPTAPRGWDRVATASDSDTARGRGAVDLPPAAKPYAPAERTPEPRTPARPVAAPTTGSTGGTGMTSIDEVRALMMRGNELLTEALGMEQQAAAQLEEAQALFLQAAEGAGGAGTEEARGMVARAIETNTDTVQNTSAAMQSVDTVAAHLAAA